LDEKTKKQFEEIEKKNSIMNEKISNIKKEIYTMKKDTTNIKIAVDYLHKYYGVESERTFNPE
jgi:hypothetical protein